MVIYVALNLSNHGQNRTLYVHKLLCIQLQMDLSPIKWVLPSNCRLKVSDELLTAIDSSHRLIKVDLFHFLSKKAS